MQYLLVLLLTADLDSPKKMGLGGSSISIVIVTHKNTPKTQFPFPSVGGIKASEGGPLSRERQKSGFW